MKLDDDDWHDVSNSRSLAVGVPVYIGGAVAVGRALLASIILIVAVALFPTVAQPGELEHLDMPSAHLGQNIPVSVYLPDGVPPEGGWPVLYLLHGLGGSSKSWPKLGGIVATMDEMITAQTIVPVLVVMPSAGNSWYVDSGDIGGPGAFATMVAMELPEFIEDRYAVRTDRGGRAIAGLSMGGYGALHLALAHPERFVAVGAMSPGLWQNVPKADFAVPADQLDLMSKSEWFHRVDGATVTMNIDVPPPGKHFGGAFGEPFDALRFNAANIFTLLSSVVAADKTLPAMFLTVGDADSHGLWRGTIDLFEMMEADGLPVSLRVTGGDHVWALWKVSIRDVLAFIDGAFVSLASR